MLSAPLRFGALLLFLTAFHSAQAQSFLYGTVYRPPDVRYLVLESSHFDIIFQEGLGEEAREMAAILEGTRAAAQRLTGTRHPLRMPVVLNRFNDRSNGYVTPLPFRQEIEGVAIKGDILSPRFSSWLVAVGPHELTHAAHAARRTGVGFAGLLGLFSPDLRRTVNLLAPPGITEGAAVYQEGQIEPGAGRLRFSRFTMKFRAAMLSDQPWSLAQLLERPAYTYPADRFYIGGAHLFEDLAERDSAAFFHRSTQLFGKWPFFGYGIPLRYGTGQAPHVLGRQFRQRVRTEEQARLDRLGPLTAPDVIAEARGLVHRRPRWIDDRTLVAYVRGYDVRPGFYRVDVQSGRRAPIGYHAITEDVYYSLSQDTTALLFARYVPDPFVPIQALAEAFRLDLAKGAVERLTESGRVVAPVEAPGGDVWALQNDGQFNQWVRISDDVIEPVTDYERAFFKSLHPSPDGQHVAALLNVGGYQGLFRARLEGDGPPRLEPWVLFEDGSVLEASWSPDGRHLLFSADPGGISNLYAYDVRAERLVRLTNAPFGALDPALSPDGQTLAYVDYQHERYNLVTIPFRPDEADVVPLEDVSLGRPLPWDEWLRRTSADVVADSVAVTFSDVRPYRPLARLRPRVLYPILRDDQTATESRFGIGLGVQGTDPLQRWSYGALGFYQYGRLWGEAGVQSGRWLLRPSLTFYSRPQTVFGSADEIEERGGEVGLQLPVVLGANVYQSSLLLSLRTSFDEARFLDERGQFGDVLGRPIGSSIRRAALRPEAVLAYRLQANARDLIPNTGLVLATTAWADVYASPGERGRAAAAQLDVYLPFLRATNTGLRLDAGVLAQNAYAFLDLARFLPRVPDGTLLLGEGTFARYGAEVVQPLWFVDDGLVILPLYLKALYAYGFGETVRGLGGATFSGAFGGRHRSAVGGGLGLQLRLFHLLDLDLRFGLAFSPEDRQWRPVYR